MALNRRNKTKDETPAPVKEKVADVVAETTEKPAKKKNLYFVSDDKDIEFIHSGCTLLDRILSGGWAVGRVINIVGDRSSGKTLLAIEAAANFAEQYPDGQIWYNEAEAAFDEPYAAALGLPVDKVFFANSDKEPAEVKVTAKIKEGDKAREVNDSNHTIEGLFEHLENVCLYHEKNKIKHGVYIVDSLDAFSDRAELERDIDKGTYGQNKAKKMSELFRRLVRRIEAAGLTLMVISQVRDNIGVTFGPTKTRSGGKALDFYASQIIWLAEIKKNKKTIAKVERVVGVDVRAQCKKNKVGMPFRECDYSIEFGYGIDDLKANADWLTGIADERGGEDWGFSSKEKVGRAVGVIKRKSDEEFFAISESISEHVVVRWREIEEGFLPRRGKYTR